MPRSHPQIDVKFSELLCALTRSRRRVFNKKDSVYQIFSSQLFANQNHDARETVFATMRAQLLACLCLLNLSQRSPKGLARLAII